MKGELFKGLTEEQIAKVKACKNEEEILKLAKEEGIELNEEQLEAVSGGCSRGGYPCPYCDSTSTHMLRVENGSRVYSCDNCHNTFVLSGLV